MLPGRRADTDTLERVNDGMLMLEVQLHAFHSTVLALLDPLLTPLQALPGFTLHIGEGVGCGVLARSNRLAARRRSL